MEKYAVTSFREGGISVIPKCWMINDHIAYWPPKTKNLRTLIIRANDANLDWPTFRITKIYGFYDNYEEAIEVEKQAAKDSESENECRGPGKRKSKPKQLYSPPPSFSGSSTQSEMSSPGAPVTELSSIEEALSKDLIVLPEVVDTITGIADVQLNLEPELDTGNHITDEESGLQNREAEDHSDEAGTDNTLVVNPSAISTISNDQIWKKLDEIDRTLKFILVRLGSLEATTSSNTELDVDFTGLPPLPLKTLGEIIDLEELLKGHDLKKKMVNKFLQVSGKSETNFIRRALAATFTNQVASSCSWTGQKNNFRMKDCMVIAVLKEAVQKCFKVSDKIFEVTVMDWFRHASQRAKREAI